MTRPARSYPTPLEVSARACRALNRHDVDQLRSVLAEDVVERIVPIGIYDGRQAVLAYHEQMFAAAPDFRVEVTHVAAVGDAVLAAWVLSATFTGAPFEGLRPNGRRVRLDGASTQVVRAGRVASAEVIFDGASFARQVGMLPIRGSARRSGHRRRLQPQNPVADAQQEAADADGRRRESRPLAETDGRSV